MLDVSTSFVVMAIFLLAGIVKGVTGMGLPTVAMGLLGAIMSPVAAAAILVLPSFVTNVWQLLSGPDFPTLARRLWPMMLAIGVGTIAGTSVLAGGSPRWTAFGLGVTLMLYAGLTLLVKQPSVPGRLEKRLSPVIGLTTGLVTGATGVFVIPTVPYLQALGMQRDELIQALGLSFTVSTVALAAGLAGRGVLPFDALATSLIALPPALLGLWLGQRIRRAVSLKAFRRWFLIGLFALGVELAMRPFF